MGLDLVSEIRRLIEDLAARRYLEIVRDGRAGRLSAEEMTAAVAEYGRTIVPMPDEGWALVDSSAQYANTAEMALDVPLWTAEEGRSDLTLSLTAAKRQGRYVIAVDDLHVL